MAKVTDPAYTAGDRTTFICDYSPPKSGLLSSAPAPPRDADFILVNSNPGHSVRVDSATVASALKQQTGKEVIFALLTRDMNRLAIQSHLLGAQMLGLDNVVVAQGDRFGGADAWRVATVADYKPTELIESISEMNLGRDFRDRKMASPTDFCIGATLDTGRKVYQQVELARRKIGAGADFLVTQPIFDTNFMEDFNNGWVEVTGELCPATVFWGIQILEAGSVSFGQVPERIAQELESGRSGVDIALEVYDRLKTRLVQHIYLLPPIRRGGERNYAAAQEFLQIVRARESV